MVNGKVRKTESSSRKKANHGTKPNSPVSGLRSPVYCLLPTAFCPQLFNFLILSTTGGWE